MPWIGLESSPPRQQLPSSSSLGRCLWINGPPWCEVLRALEHPPKPGESSSAGAERILYFTLMSAIDAGLIRRMEDALQVLRHASRPLGPMGAEWLERQEQKLKSQHE